MRPITLLLLTVLLPGCLGPETDYHDVIPCHFYLGDWGTPEYVHPVTVEWATENATDVLETVRRYLPETKTGVEADCADVQDEFFRLLDDFTATDGAAISPGHLGEQYAFFDVDGRLMALSWTTYRSHYPEWDAAHGPEA